MALYEGIALIQEKQALVLDLGHDYTKFGFTGEPAPRCIIRSEFWCPKEKRFKKVHDYNTTEELYENLVHMLHLLYFRHVLVNPKERRVIVVESLLTETLYRETLAKVLYLHYGVSGVVWADRGRMCAVTLGAPSVLVVSIGALETEVSAVVHNSPILNATMVSPLASRVVHKKLADLLNEDNGRELNLSHEVIEDIKVKTCFVGGLDRAVQRSNQSGPNPAPSVQYPVNGRTITVSGKTRELAAELLFYKDNEKSSIPELILRCIAASPVDTRQDLAENILITGGGSHLPGVKSRIAQELRHLITEEPFKTIMHVTKFKFHANVCLGSSAPWVGGAIVGGGDAAAVRSLLRDRYVRLNKLPDWIDLRDNTHPKPEM